jgi:colanic acid/amylovoran biosynthesis glycosyltransferase
MLEERGIKSTVQVLVWDQPGPLTQSLHDAGIDYRIIRSTGTTQERIHEIVENLETTDFDIFIPNLVLPAYFASRYVREAGKPTVGVLHSDDNFYQGLIDQFLAGRRRDALSAVVAVSSLLKQKSLRNIRHDTKAVYIPYGVSIPKEDRVPRNDGKLSLMYAGRLVQEQKRIHDVVHAMLRCTKELSNCTGVIIGDGPEREDLERLLKSSNITNSISMTGRLSAEDVQREMQKHDVILLLSDYEGLPIALLEGMACGMIPIVTQMDSGIPELIQHDVNGLIVANRSEAVVSSVSRLRHDPLLLSRLSRAARETIASRYSSESCADRWEKLIRDLHLNNSLKKNKLRLPRKFDLPKVHPFTSCEDPRAPDLPFWKTLTRGVRAFLASARKH